MRVTDTLLGAIRLDFSCRRAYFTTDWAEVNSSNIRSCQIACLVVAVLVPAMSLAARAVYGIWAPTVAHYGFFVAAVAMLPAIHLLRPFAERSAVVGSALCLVVEAILLGFAVAIDTVFSDGVPGVFVQTGSIALAVVLVMPYSLPLVVAAIAEISFVVLSVMYKSPVIVRYDIFSVLVGFMLAMAVSQVIIELRLRDFRARERYRELSQRDALCGIYNKGAVVAMASSYFALMNPHVTGSAFLIDVDRFKYVNDTYGHHAGDEVLRGVGEMLLSMFRVRDTVGRFGGDEFIVLAEGLIDVGALERKATLILERMREVGRSTVGEEITCSIGVLVVCDHEVTYESVLRQVDAALYESKHMGRARATIRHYADEAVDVDRRHHGEEGE